MQPNPHLARFAAQEYRSRHQRAHEAVRSGTMDVATATAHLRPWLAIACLCGCDLPELDEGLAAHRTKVIVWPYSRSGEQAEVTESEARALLAQDICARPRWEPILRAARDKACNPFADPTALPANTDADRAISLVTLAMHFGLKGWMPPTMIDAMVAEQAA
jgi:hypothetical protein